LTYACCKAGKLATADSGNVQLACGKQAIPTHVEERSMDKRMERRIKMQRTAGFFAAVSIATLVLLKVLGLM
jgi:hypothetical protein